jgi:hypothetical protein
MYGLKHKLILLLNNWNCDDVYDKFVTLGDLKRIHLS